MATARRRRRVTARERIYAYLARRTTGATRAEIVRATGIPENTVNPRVVELVRAQAIREVGVRGHRATLAVV